MAGFRAINRSLSVAGHDPQSGPPSPPGSDGSPTNDQESAPDESEDDEEDSESEDEDSSSEEENGYPNETLPELPARHGSHWSAEEDRLLQRGIERNWKASQIKEELIPLRTVGGIYARMRMCSKLESLEAARRRALGRRRSPSASRTPHREGSVRWEREHTVRGVLSKRGRDGKDEFELEWAPKEVRTSKIREDSQGLQYVRMFARRWYVRDVSPLAGSRNGQHFSLVHWEPTFELMPDRMWERCCWSLV